MPLEVIEAAGHRTDGGNITINNFHNSVVSQVLNVNPENTMASINGDGGIQTSAKKNWREKIMQWAVSEVAKHVYFGLIGFFMGRISYPTELNALWSLLKQGGGN